MDPSDPRLQRADRHSPRARRLVASRGPGVSPLDATVRRFRVAVPVVFFAGLAAIAAVFFVGLNPGSAVQRIAPEPVVRAALASRPRWVCLNDAQPCAWLSEVDGELLALSTAGPLREEDGRMGVGWCPTSGWYGANNTGSRFDPRGLVVRGPAPRGLDRHAVLVDGDGWVTIDFSALTTGLQASLTTETIRARGPECLEVRFDPSARLSVQ